MQCGIISYSFWSLLSTIMITMRLLAIVYYAESTCLTFYTFLFRVFLSLLGGMGASIALLNEQDRLSWVFTPVVFHFYMHSAYDWKD